ncbi:MAG: ATP-binding cassette domain-containing protein [Polyangiales bacterium]
MPGDPAHLRVRLRVEGDAARPPRLDVAFEGTSTVTAVMGPSGAGKTTLLACIAGVLRPSAGRVIVGDDRLYDEDARVFVPPHRRRVAMVFQTLALFPHLTVWENVAYGLRAETPRARRDASMAWLERVRAAGLADRSPSTLSGGEAQRVALARALASQPRLLLLDEPFSSLNPSLRVELGDLLRALLAETPVPVLLVTHDLADARRLASRILQLDAGRIVGDDPV